MAQPSLTLSFIPSTVTVGNSAQFDVRVMNTGATNFTNVGLDVTLPAGVSTTANGTFPLCVTGTVTITGGNHIVLTGGTSPPNPTFAVCNFQVSVSTTTTGVKTVTGTATSDQGSSNSSTATLTVNGPPPTISKVFGTASMPVGGTTTLTFSLGNGQANAGTATNVSFTDSLPAGLVVSTPNGASNTCGGTLGATAGGGSVTLSGVSMAANATCTVVVNVTGTTAGIKNNSTQVQSDQGAGNTTNTSITITPAFPPTILKSFGAVSIPLGGTTTLSFTISNPNSFATVTNVAFTDSLPAGLVVSTPNGVSGSCGGGSIGATAGSGSVTLSGASIAASTQCTFSVNVTGTTAGIKNNTTQVQSDQGAGNTTNTSVTVLPASAPTITKSFGAASIPFGGTTSLTFTISNPNSAASVTNVAFTDSLPSGLVVSTPNGLSGSCGGGTIGATAGGGSITLAGATITASSQCTFAVNVTGTTAGTKVNSTQVTSDQGTGNTTTATLTVDALTAPTITKAFGAASVNVNSTTSLTFTINNPNAGGAVTNVAFTDLLPAGMVVATPNALTGSCGGGTITATSGAGTVNLSGATIAASGSCTFAVNVLMTTAGSKVNSVTATSDQGNSNTSTASVNVLAATTTAVVSSLNPSQFGQSVTFTATVTGPPGTPTGNVVFSDGATVLATVALSGGGTATFTTSSLSKGAHTITAAYAGDGSHMPSSGSVQQTVNIPTDSLRLRQLQVIGTNLIAQGSGQAISGAIDSAINDGFNDSPALITPSDTGLHFAVTGDPATQGSIGKPTQDDGVRDFTLNPTLRRSPASGLNSGDSMSALGYSPAATKGPVALPREPRIWTAWADLRGFFWNRSSIGSDITGNQFNAIAGLTARVTPDLLVGVLGGYETAKVDSQILAGTLKGNGWTVGGYVGWRFAQNLRLDAGVAHSMLNYDGTAGTANGTFTGRRWLASGGVTGDYKWSAFVLQPSARIYGLWEHQNEYTDSLATVQAARNFSTGRASGGMKVALPSQWDDMRFTPYIGLYGDYYFTKDDNTTAALAPIPLIQGWSARVTSGIGITMKSGAQISVGGELGGLGSAYTLWTVRSRASVPF